jgi:AmpE protein
MIFLSLIAVLAIINFTGVAPSIQQDTWFLNLLARLRSLPGASSAPLLPMILAIAIPLALLVFCILVVLYYGLSLFLFFIYVPVFLYSLGRGNFIADVEQYIATATRGDNVAASQLVDDMLGRAEVRSDLDDVTDWKALHTQALKVISYRSFEKTFAVLFWFVIAGAVGALLYRLSVIYRDQTIPNTVDAALADRWLWLIEMPAVRLMGLTWAFVGNFDSSPWRESLLDTENSSITILNNSLRGALSAPTDAYRKTNDSKVVANTKSDSIPSEENVDAETAEALEDAQEVIEDLVGVTLSPQAEPAYSFALVKSSVPLYTRSLLFCVGVIAFATLFI